MRPRSIRRAARSATARIASRSPGRLTASPRSVAPGRLTGEAQKIYARAGGNGRRRFPALLRRLRLAVLHKRRGVVRMIGASAGAASASATRSGRRGRSGAARPYPGSMILWTCLAGLPIEATGSLQSCAARPAKGKQAPRRAVSSAVEHWFYTPLVGSSILSPPTINHNKIQ
jgi:hypothetical protein